MARLDELRREIRQRGERIVRGASIQLEEELRRTAPKVTRELERSITVRFAGGSQVLRAEAAAEADHAAPVIRGARPHVIRPKKVGGFLAFLWPGDPRGGPVRRLPDGRVLLRSVNHPGNEPNLFWRHALGRWGALLQQQAGRLG